MPAFVRYRIRFCCDTCRRWDVLDPGALLVQRHDTWAQALGTVKRLQRGQIRAARRVSTTE